jgi:hypothetical protein
MRIHTIDLAIKPADAALAPQEFHIAKALIRARVSW